MKIKHLIIAAIAVVAMTGCCSQPKDYGWIKTGLDRAAAQLLWTAEEIADYVDENFSEQIGELTDEEFNELVFEVIDIYQSYLNGEEVNPDDLNNLLPGGGEINPDDLENLLPPQE